jgi:hypothetical protein
LTFAGTETVTSASAFSGVLRGSEPQGYTARPKNGKYVFLSLASHTADNNATTQNNSQIADILCSDAYIRQ